VNTSGSTRVAGPAVLLLGCLVLGVSPAPSYAQDKGQWLRDAVRTNNVDRAMTALGVGADPNAAARKGLTALKIARDRNCSDIVKILEDAGAR